MTARHVEAADRGAVGTIRAFADQAFSRAAGASLVTGNRIRLLRDARENYPAWLDAITRATRFVHFESYIVHDDDVGEQFARARRLGGDQLLTDDTGRSGVSFEDFAVALTDELEKPRHVRQRFTVGY